MRPPPPKDGPGSELKRLIAELGLSEFKGCGCAATASDMDKHGVDWCRENRQCIVGKLKVAASRAGWGEWAKAGAKAAMQGWLRIGEPESSLLDEAIRRWEAKTQAA